MEVKARDTPPATNSAKVLYIEDNKADASLIRYELQNTHLLNVSLVIATRLQESLEHLQNGHFDLVLLDLNLPDSQGMATFEKLRQKFPELPFIVLTGEYNDTLAVEILRRGAQDFLLKQQAMPHLLPRAIQFAIERHRTATQLQESEARFRNIIEADVDATFIVDREGVVLFVNPAAAEMFGRNINELLFHPFGFPIVGDQTTELDIIRRNGTTGIAEMRVVNIIWQDKQAYLASLRDITAHKRAQEKILELNAILERRVRERTVELEVVNKELESFSYSVAHDLRTPLRAITGFSKMLLDSTNLSQPEVTQQYLQRICRAADKMGQLINDLLNLSHINRYEFKPSKVNLSKLAHTILIELKQNEPHRQVTLQIADDLSIEGDFNLLRIALANLLGNAWKFTGKQTMALIEVNAIREESQSTVFFVRDNGAGFEMKYAHKLFGAFQRLHTEEEFPGTGIGLAIVHRVIKRHCGKVWAESEPGVGSTFYFSL